ncbi:Protein DOP-2 a, partial [Aphelenchoides avenae]
MPSAAPRTGLQMDAAAAASSSALGPASVFRDFVTRSYAAGLASLTATTTGSEEATTTAGPTTPDVTRTTLSFEEQWPMPEVPQHPGLFLYGFCLVLIPTATILGNLLVIVSVLRFKALHSAINFLILGLAVADLLVALFVMPYAVYVYIQGGYWFLGPLMCDIYNASDVACSTASILLLAVISFDRYRAVSRPIQYSRQSQNIRRVFLIIIAIWLVSLALASPMVLGVNHRPADANPYECRFYNPEFSITSSVISFIIPCFLVLFVYIRIMMALRKREKAAKARRFANQDKDEGIEKSSDDDAGRIVAGP